MNLYVSFWVSKSSQNHMLDRRHRRTDKPAARRIFIICVSIACLKQLEAGCDDVSRPYVA